MNNITKKLIKDGSETRQAKFNLISTIIGFFLLMFGASLLFIKANSVGYIDASGILHENFYLLPLSFIFLFSGMTVFLVMGIKYIRKNKK